MACEVEIESLDRLNIELIPVCRATAACCQAKLFGYRQPAGVFCFSVKPVLNDLIKRLVAVVLRVGRQK